MKPAPSTLRDALQYLAVRRERDERWTRKVIRRTQQREWACRVCSAVVASFKRLMES